VDRHRCGFARSASSSAGRRSPSSTCEPARRLLFDHIVFHNTHRLHSAQGYRTPNDYEKINPNLSA
jgi:hypothetical protein